MSASETIVVPTLAGEPAGPARNERLRAVLASHVFQAGAVIVLFWIICAIFGPWFEPYSPYNDDLLNTLDPPSWQHWFGTDQIGRDILSRVIAGSRSSLLGHWRVRRWG
jgi:peptide/nickel transport system permease protein